MSRRIASTVEVGPERLVGEQRLPHPQGEFDLRQPLLVVPRRADGPDAPTLQPLDDPLRLLLRIPAPRLEPVVRLIATAAETATLRHCGASEASGRRWIGGPAARGRRAAPGGSGANTLRGTVSSSEFVDSLVGWSIGDDSREWSRSTSSW
ncbi:MAG: hypothetical protein OXQ89_23925, partial [Rhodospirillaceae bacterium]|nr:hypothetical protein [Rhodospirillaceae bacterium]